MANALAPHVNRRAIMNRSPEARLAGRLFDCDKVVRPLLKESAEDFYVAVQPAWEWNSRYWEQRALLVAPDNLDQAISFAKHAVAIEQHPYPLTTLGKLLLKRMENATSSRDDCYAEAAACLNDAIDREHRFSRITIHPYMTLFAGTAKYLELGGRLTKKDKDRMDKHLDEAKFEFFGDLQLDSTIARLEHVL